MTFAIIGYGVVGQATRSAAEFHGHECVAVVDPIYDYMEDAASKGEVMPGLYWSAPMQAWVSREELRMVNAIDLLKADLAFVCVPTPSADDGSCDTSAVRAAIGDLEARGYQGCVVVRSTVPPAFLEEFLRDLGPTDRRRFLLNPEFLRVRDTEHTSRWPAFVVIGGNPQWPPVSAERDPWVRRLVRFYEPYFEDTVLPPIFVTDYRTAAFYKYLSNALLAAAVTLADEAWEVARALGVDWSMCYAIAQRCPVTPKTIRVDPDDRGFGGACLPKDLEAFVHIAAEGGSRVSLLERVAARNTQIRAEQERQRNHGSGFGPMENGQWEC